MATSWLKCLAALLLLVVSQACPAAEVDDALLLAATPDAIRRVADMPLNELISRTAGEVTDNAIRNYANDFDAYWANSVSGRTGEVFEAYVAHTANTRFRATSDPTRLIPTAALRFDKDKTDLLLFDAKGGVTRIQSKLGVQGLVDAIESADYAGMKLLTSQETFDTLKQSVDAKTASAMQRGVPLDSKWKSVDDAFTSGRILSKLPCGSPLPERSFVTDLGRRHYSAAWAAKTGAVTDDLVRATQTITPPPVRVSGRGPIVSSPAPARVPARLPAAPAAPPRVPNIATAADDVAAPILGSLSTVAGPLAVGVDLAIRAGDIAEAQRSFEDGRISVRERDTVVAKNAAGFGGSTVGAVGGAYGGAAIGTFFCPGIGTAIGGFLGSIFGSVGGGAFGEAVVADTW
jgi:hypothetical protein